MREDFLNDITWRRIASMWYWRTFKHFDYNDFLVEARPIELKSDYPVKRIIRYLFSEKLLHEIRDIHLCEFISFLSLDIIDRNLIFSNLIYYI